MVYFRYNKGREKPKMTTFQLIVLIAYVAILAWKFVVALDRECFGLAGLFAFEIMAFAYLARVLM